MSDIRENLLDRIREPVASALDALTVDGRARVEQLLLGIEADLSALHTVPASRQKKYLARIEAQLLASLERERIKVIKATRSQVAFILTILIRAVVAAV